MLIEPSRLRVDPVVMGDATLIDCVGGCLFTNSVTKSIDARPHSSTVSFGASECCHIVRYLVEDMHTMPLTIGRVLASYIYI